jgi:magnesium transporter
MNGTHYLKFLNPLALFNTKRTRDIFKVNPTVAPERKEADNIVVKIFDYSPALLNEYTLSPFSVPNFTLSAG